VEAALLRQDERQDAGGQGDLHGVPKIKRHTKVHACNTTIATDGTRLIVMLGSEGLYSFDMNGTLQWKKDLGVLDSGFYMAPAAQWEFSSSPLLVDNVVIVQADVQKDSFLAAFDAATGKELWRTARHDVPTFSTPAIHRVGGQTQIILNGWKEIASYDFKTGQQIWTMKGGGDIPVPVPVIGNGLIYVTNAHGVGGSPIYAIRETAKGDISLAPDTTTNAGIAWSVKADGAYLISPVLYRDQLYVTKTNGAFSVFNATTGERIYQGRLGSGTRHSPRQRSPPTASSTSRMKTATSTWSRPGRSRFWRRTRSAESEWRRRRCRKECCTSDSSALLSIKSEVKSQKSK
jgi:outer membrane protein assembly factor BamB